MFGCMSSLYLHMSQSFMKAFSFFPIESTAIMMFAGVTSRCNIPAIS